MSVKTSQSNGFLFEILRLFRLLFFLIIIKYILTFRKPFYWNCVSHWNTCWKRRSSKKIIISSGTFALVIFILFFLFFFYYILNGSVFSSPSTFIFYLTMTEPWEKAHNKRPHLFTQPQKKKKKKGFRAVFITNVLTKKMSHRIYW